MLLYILTKRLQAQRKNLFYVKIKLQPKVVKIHLSLNTPTFTTFYETFMLSLVAESMKNVL